MKTENIQSSLTWKTRLDNEKIIHQNFDELYNELFYNLNNLRKIKITNEKKSNYKINYIDIADLIIYTCDIIKIKLNDNTFTYGIYNPVSKNYIREKNFLNKLIGFIIEHDYRCNLSISATSKKVDDLIQNNVNRIRIANLAPSYIIKFNNCIFDIKEKQIHDGLDENSNEYDFINCLKYNLKSLDDVNQNKLKIIKKLFSLWGGDCQKELLKQITLAAIEGNNRNKFIIMESNYVNYINTNDINDKLIFQHILNLLVGIYNRKNIDLNFFGKDKMINEISNSTKLIISDDMLYNYKIPKKAMNNLKSFILNDIVNVKFGSTSNKNIQTNALIIQNINNRLKSNLDLIELQQQMIIYYWPYNNFILNFIKKYNIDKLLGYGVGNNDKDIDFIETILAYVIWTTDYFNEFDI